jgi:hypothetical protein
LNEDVNEDWETCNNRCEGETYEDADIRETFFCLDDCQVATFESMEDAGWDAIGMVLTYAIVKYVIPVMLMEDHDCCMNYLM